MRALQRVAHKPPDWALKRPQVLVRKSQTKLEVGLCHFAHQVNRDRFPARRSPKLELTCTPEALIDVAAAIGLRWQQEVVQAEAPRCLLLGTSSGELKHPGFVVC